MSKRRQAGLPRGIRRRGRSFEVNVFVKGAGRRTCSCDTLEDAVLARARLRKALEAAARGEEAPVESGGEARPEPEAQFPAWTLQQAIDETFRIGAPEGWRGMKSEHSQRKVANRLVEYFGEHQILQDISTPMIQAFVSDCEDRGNSGSTINGRTSALHKLMRIASVYGGMTKRPPVFPMRKTPNKHRVRYLSRDEESKVLGWLQTLGEHDVWDTVKVLIDTGLRPSELWHVEVQDIVARLDKSPVLVIYGMDAQGTKTGGFRSVPLSKAAADIFERRCDGLGEDDKPFGSMSTESLHYVWQKVRTHMGKVEDPQFVPYICRHTCASRLAQAGLNRTYIQRWMGHSTPGMTDRYMHLNPESLDEGAEIMDGFGVPEGEAKVITLRGGEQ